MVDVLDTRIRALEVLLAHPADELDMGVVRAGSIVELDLDDQIERFLVVPREAAPPGVATVSPKSALGHAILGARAGDTVSYVPAGGTPAKVTVHTVG